MNDLTPERVRWWCFNHDQLTAALFEFELMQEQLNTEQAKAVRDFLNSDIARKFKLIGGDK